MRRKEIIKTLKERKHGAAIAREDFVDYQLTKKQDKIKASIVSEQIDGFNVTMAKMKDTNTPEAKELIDTIKEQQEYIIEIFKDIENTVREKCKDINTDITAGEDLLQKSIDLINKIKEEKASKEILEEIEDLELDVIEVLEGIEEDSRVVELIAMDIHAMFGGIYTALFLQAMLDKKVRNIEFKKDEKLIADVRPTLLKFDLCSGEIKSEGVGVEDLAAVILKI